MEWCQRKVAPTYQAPRAVWGVVASLRARGSVQMVNWHLSSYKSTLCTNWFKQVLNWPPSCPQAESLLTQQAPLLCVRVSQFRLLRPIIGSRIYGERGNFRVISRCTTIVTLLCSGAMKRHPRYAATWTISLFILPTWTFDEAQSDGIKSHTRSKDCVLTTP